jgi:hypothetical protein
MKNIQKIFFKVFRKLEILLYHDKIYFWFKNKFIYIKHN